MAVNRDGCVCGQRSVRTEPSLPRDVVSCCVCGDSHDHALRVSQVFSLEGRPTENFRQQNKGQMPVQPWSETDTFSIKNRFRIPSRFLPSHDAPTSRGV